MRLKAFKLWPLGRCEHVRGCHAPLKQDRHLTSFTDHIVCFYQIVCHRTDSLPLCAHICTYHLVKRDRSSPRTVPHNVFRSNHGWCFDDKSWRGFWKLIIFFVAAVKPTSHTFPIWNQSFQLYWRPMKLFEKCFVTDLKAELLLAQEKFKQLVNIEGNNWDYRQ